MKSKWVVLLASLAVASSTASANLIYSLTCVSTSNCAAGPFGTVDLVQTTADTVTVTLQLIAGDFITNNSGGSLVWNLTGDPTLLAGTNVSAITTTGQLISPFSFPGTTTEPPFSSGSLGQFDYGINESTSNSHCCSDLSFTITLSTGLSINDFVANSGGFFFGADIYDVTLNADGATFGVASNVCSGGSDCGIPVQSLPEPFSFVLVGSGLALLGMRRLRRR